MINLNLNHMNDSFCSDSSLTLAGVGPGDPDLLTAAAIDAIRNSTLIAYPVAREECESYALNIASKWIENGQKFLPLIFPMVENIQVQKEAWKVATNQLVGHVCKGEKVTFICQGDISF